MPRLSVIACLAVGAAGATCKPGYKLKKTLKGLTCDTGDATNAAACNTNCCEPDDKTCGGLNVACTTGYRAKDVAGATQAQKDAWANLAATSATAQQICCSTQATCASGGYTCPAGERRIAGASATCTNDVASCAKTVGCCEKDPNTCNGVKVSGVLFDPATGCTGTFKAPTKGDGWKATQATAATAKQACCATEILCSTTAAYSCPAGYKKKDSDKLATSKCTGDVKSCGAAGSNCCEQDKFKCGGHTVTCSGNTYTDGSLADKVFSGDSGDKNVACCSPKATCAASVCPGGSKKKANSDNIVCAGDTTTCPASCCEADTNTCGGQTGLACAVGFYDESMVFGNKPKYTQAEQDAWKSKATTAKTKNTDCCTKKAECAANTVALGETTTPAAVASTTPAAPARLFSEHKEAVKSSSSSVPNMVYLAVGGFIGMAALHIYDRRHTSTRFVAVAQMEGEE